MNVVPGEVEGATQPEKASNFKGGKKHMWYKTMTMQKIKR